VDALSDDRIGKLVDERYRILEAMASGSMGAVYKGERVGVGKLVAIKFLHESFAKDAEFLARFERETRVMGKLAHTNCVSVVDFGVWEGSPYIVMDYVAGTTLRDLLDDSGALAPTRALDLARQLAAGLAHAHAQDIVHRDIKPANLMISDEIGRGDHLRILDFGLARLRGAVGRDATQANVVVGTPNYMAPEQTVGGGLIDARTDIYAAGVVLFEMISGDRPFQAEDTLALLGMHRAAPVPQLADRIPVGTALPAGLQEIIDKTMAKAPNDRYQTAIELADAIDRVAGTRVTGDASIGNSSKRAAAVAPTMVAIPDPAAEKLKAKREKRREAREKKGTGMAMPVLAGILILGGAGIAIWKITSKKEVAPPLDAAPVVAAITPPAIDAAPPPPPPIDAVPPPIDAATDAATGAATDAPPIVDDSAIIAVALADDAAPDAPPDGEIEMDPATADDPDPSPAKETDTEEAAGAPETETEAEAKAPPAPVLAKSLPETLQLIKDGKRDVAIASLLSIWKTQPNSAYIPFLLGNLYADQRWWSVAMDHYKAAINKNAAYKSNPTLVRNLIRMLASTKTQRKAAGFLRYTIGRPALPYLRQSAAHDTNATVKRWASALSKQIR
jgi:serine/threonine-protein kinase